MTKRVRNQEIVLTRRDDWYMHEGQQVRRKPYVKEVRFRIIEDVNTSLFALKKGEIDELELRAEQWVTQTGDDEFYSRNTKAYGTEWSYGYIGWNVTVPFFSDKRVRQAMAYALNHDEMINTICYGLYEPGRGVYHPTSWMFPEPGPEPYKQDLDKAEVLLDDAGWTDSDGDGVRDREIGGNRVKFEFTILLPSGSETGQRILELFKQNLDQIGVVCNIKPSEFTVLQESARTHKFQALTMGWGTGTDPDTGTNLWTTESIEQNGRNYGMYSNPEIDRLFEQGRKEFDSARRAEIYRRVHNILWEDQPYMWLYYRSSFYGFNHRLRGYLFSPRNPYGYAPGFLSIWVPAA
jgi:peptide/nickel transport system substrate-binding protein